MHSAASTPIPPKTVLSLSLDVPDDVALNAVIGGNREMFEVIVRRYNQQLYRVGMAYLRDHGQVEDAMQNTYLKAFLHLERFRASSSFGTWLTRIMINECLMTLRQRKRFTFELLENVDVPAEDAVTVPDTDRLRRDEIKPLLEGAIRDLPRKHRTVYLLREIQHLSTQETARCLGISAADVKVSLHRAREGLKTALLKSSAGIELFAYPAVYCDPFTARVMAAIRAETSA